MSHIGRWNESDFASSTGSFLRVLGGLVDRQPLSAYTAVCLHEFCKTQIFWPRLLKNVIYITSDFPSNLLRVKMTLNYCAHYLGRPDCKLGALLCGPWILPCQLSVTMSPYLLLERWASDQGPYWGMGNLNTQQGDGDFGTILGYLVSSRPDWPTQWDPDSNKTKRNKTKPSVANVVQW